MFPESLVLSGNSIIAALQTTAIVLLLPGLLISMAAGGNVHGSNFWVAATINAFIYFGLGWIGYNFLRRLKTKRTPSEIAVDKSR